MTDQYPGATPPVNPAPAYGAAPSAPYGAPAVDPGRTMGIIALVAVFFISILGLILGYVARSTSKKAGFTNTPAKIAIILGWIFLALGIIGTIVAIVVFATIGANAVNELCAGMPAGVYELTTGGTITCP